MDPRYALIGSNEESLFQTSQGEIYGFVGVDNNI